MLLKTNVEKISAFRLAKMSLKIKQLKSLAKMLMKRNVLTEDEGEPV
jgi:hypothetical protein